MITLNLPDYVNECINTLENAGFEGYAVGGCVRDGILGKIPNDYDVTTNALPSDVKRIFEKVIATGEKFGTSTVLFGKEKIEVTTYRYDGVYDDFRRPSEIVFGKSLKEDLARRDFTVNAIAYSPKAGIIDPFFGTEDIKNKIIRTVGKPELRFSEDALRIMRCFRFSSQLGFTIENDTLKGALSLLPLLEKISVERIREELFKIICSVYPEKAGILIKSAGLEFLGIKKDLMRPLNILNLLPENPDMRLGAFLFITNSKECAKNLKLSNKQLYTSVLCCDLLSAPLTETKQELKRIMSKNSDFNYTDFFKIYSVIHNADTTLQTDFYNEIIRKGEPFKISMLKINGNDLKKIGITDGTKIGNILKNLLDAVIEEPEINTKPRLLSLAKEITNQ